MIRTFPPTSTSTACRPRLVRCGLAAQLTNTTLIQVGQTKRLLNPPTSDFDFQSEFRRAQSPHWQSKTVSCILDQTLTIASGALAFDERAPQMKFTQYFLHTRQRPDRQRITDEWIQHTVEHPLRREVQSDGRIRCWAFVVEENRYLRVILLSDGETVHNAFFDRSFREEPR